MTNPEFSTQFDILWNNISSDQAPGLNEYEKSVFLTKAQTQLVREYFNARVDGVGGGFDGSIKRQYDFSSLIKTEELDPVSLSGYTPLNDRSLVYQYKKKYYLIVDEILKEREGNTRYSVRPIDYNEYQRLMQKPYKYPLKRTAWRMFTGSNGTGPVVEVIGRFGNVIHNMIVRYIEEPSPIILTNIADYGVTIGNEDAKTPCKLPGECHEELLERAVTLAKIAWAGGTMTQAQTAQR